jgi:hypothetical protein
MPYTKTTWVDRVVSGGTVITAGTPLSASNLNKIENQLETITEISESASDSAVASTIAKRDSRSRLISNGFLTFTLAPQNINTWFVLSELVILNTFEGASQIVYLTSNSTTTTANQSFFTKFYIRVRQQALLGNAPVVDFIVLEDYNFNSRTNLIAVITQQTSTTTRIRLYAKNPFGQLGITMSVLNHDTWNLSIQGWQPIPAVFGTTTPSGVATITPKSAGLFINSNENIGIGNSSPTEKLDVTGNIKSSGTINAGGTITANGGLTIPTGQSLTIPDGSINGTKIVASSITGDKLVSGTITQLKMGTDSVGQSEIKTAVNSSFSGSLSASATNGALLGGVVNIGTTLTYAFFPTISTSSTVAVTGNIVSGTDGRASFSLRNSASTSSSYNVYIRYITA